MAEKREKIIADLIERIEAATSGDREIDRDIAFATGWRMRAGVWLVPDEFRHPVGVNVFPPFFTGSLDAAMTLVPRGWIVEIRRYFNGDGEFVASVSLTDSFTVGRGCHPEEEFTTSSRAVERRPDADPTPRALCAAALRAAQSRAPEEKI